MKSLILSAFSLVLLASISNAFAQQAAPEPVVKFTAVADMPSLTDPKKKDNFKVTLADAQVITDLELICQAGRTSMMVFRTDRGCSISGTGALVAPGNKKVQRVQYKGGYIVTSDSTADATAIKLSYLAVGKVPASEGQFGGAMKIKPELTASGAQGLTNVVLKKLGQQEGGGLIDNRVDPIDLDRLNVPSAGLPSDKGCTWVGSMIFAYQSDSWYMDLKANCDGKEYAFKGNMPWTDSLDANGTAIPSQTQYDLTLTLPGAEISGDDALFASESGDADLFASVDGISGQIIMKQGKLVKTKIDGVETETPSFVEATGTFTGTNVPLTVVRSLTEIIAINASGFFGG